MPMQTPIHFSSETTDAGTLHTTLQLLKENNYHCDYSTQPVKIPPPPYALVAQMVKHLPTMWETQAQSLG